MTKFPLIRHHSLLQIIMSLALLLVLGLPVSSMAQTSIFNIQTSPSPNPFGNTLNAVAALSTSDAWAVGYKNDNNLNESRTLTMHWDGNTWKVIPSPNPGSIPSCTNANTGNVLSAISAVATDDVWAVGFSFTCTSADLVPMALHWNGTKWNVAPTPALLTTGNSAFNGITAISSKDIYAVGYQPASNGAVLTLVEHWDGNTWTVVPTPNGNNTGNVLFAVTAISSTDIWAVGDKVAPNVAIKTLTMHFDGNAWTIVPSPNPVLTGFLTANELLSVQAVSTSDVTAVGRVRDGNNLDTVTLIEHWDGTRWKVVPSPNQGQSVGDFNSLQSVTAISGTDLYAAGFFATAATNGQQETMVQHFDGHSWTIIPSPTKGLAQQLNGVFALPGTGNVWSVGAAAQNGTDPETGFLIIPKTLVLFSPIG